MRPSFHLADLHYVLILSAGDIAGYCDSVEIL